MFEADTKFLQDMIAHHQAALEMSKGYLKTPAGKRTVRVTNLAEGIVKAQTVEINQMKNWLRAKGEPAGKEGGMKM